MISIICNLGSNHAIVGGQFVRSKNICEYVINNTSEKAIIVDISSSRKIYTYSMLLLSLVFSRKVVLLPGPNLLKKISLLQKICSTRKFVLVAVGGWLPELAKKSTSIKKLLLNIDSIWVQTKGLINELNEQNIQASLLSNFKNNIFPLKPCIEKKSSKTIKLVFMSRVARDKGIFESIEAVSELNGIATLDIYGPMHDCNLDVDDFVNIKYKGILDTSNIQNTLKNYDCLIFPTYYPGEGFPGVLLDAFFSGITVIASNWRFNSEIVLDYQNGVLISAINKRAIKKKVIELHQNAALLQKLKQGAHRSSYGYFPDVVMDKFITKLNQEK